MIRHIRHFSITALHTFLIAASLFTAGAQAQGPAGYTLTTVDEKASKPVTQVREFIVVLEDEPLIAYDGGLRDLKATSAKGQRTAKFDPKEASKSQYKTFLRTRQNDVESALNLALPSAKVTRRLDTVTNALVVRTNGNPSARDELALLPGVKFVYESETRRTQMDKSLPLINAPEAWEVVGEQSTAGQGVRVAVIDSGIAQSHAMFLGRGFVKPTDLPTDDYCSEVPSFCNGKLIVARYYPPLNIDDLVADDIEEATPGDRDGHGTHVAGTAVGNRVSSRAGVVSGVAPGAYLMVYKGLFTDSEGGSSGSDANLVQALEDAVNDGADVINNSWGGGASMPGYRFYRDIFGRIEAAGVVIANSAGNEGPGSATVGCPACADAGLAVASSETEAYSVSVSSVAMSGVTVVAVPGGDVQLPSDVTAPAIIAGNVAADNRAACAAFDAGSLTNSIAIAFRGANLSSEEGCLFEDKVNNVKAAGAIGIIVINNEAGEPFIMGGLTDPNFPSVMVSLADGQTLIDAYSEGDTATIGAVTAGDIPAGAISNFSSRGPNIESGVLKPDITAPGNPILSAYINTSPPYAALGGTSMASPHVAGAAAVLIQHRPGLTAEQYKSILMTSANKEGVLTDSGRFVADIFTRGSGALDVFAALNTEITFDKPSIGGRCFAVCEFSVTGTNIGTDTLELTGTMTASGDGVTYSLSDASFSVSAGEDFSVSITVDATEASSDWFLGNLELVEVNGLATAMDIPMSIALAAVEDDNIFSMSGSVTPGVDSSMSVDISALADADSTSLYEVAIVHPDDVSIVPTSAASSSRNAVEESFNVNASTGLISWSGRMNPLQGSINPSTFFATGLSLVDDFGGGEQGQSFDCANEEVWTTYGYCDDIKVSLDFASFEATVAGELIETLLIDSNGLLMFNPSDADVEKHTALSAPFPLAEVPNSVLAPFWTDLLQGESGIGELYTGFVTNEGDTWFVVEWYEAREWSQEILITDPRFTFSVWIKAGSDEIHFNYVDLPMIPAYLSVGIEDSSGSSGITHYFQGAGSAPESGTSLSIDVDEFIGSASIDYQVHVASVASITAPTVSAAANTATAINLGESYNVTDVAAPVMATLEILGQRYQSSINLNIQHSDTSIVITTQPSNGSLSDAGNETFEYMPNTGFEGQDSFGYVIRDGNGQDSLEAMVMITVGSGGSSSSDSDGDGLSDEQEAELGTNPNRADTDGDGLSDADEVNRGTNPLDEDSDGDGFSDFDEVADGTSPTDANDMPMAGSNILILLEALRSHQAKSNPIR